MLGSGECGGQLNGSESNMPLCHDAWCNMQSRAVKWKFVCLLFEIGGFCSHEKCYCDLLGYDNM